MKIGPAFLGIVLATGGCSDSNSTSVDAPISAPDAPSSGGADARHTLFSRSDLGASQAPAVTYDASEPRLFLVEEWNGNLGGAGYLRLFAISGPVGAEVFSSIGWRQ